MAFETINRGESNWASKINNNFAEVSNIVAGSDKVSTTDFEAYKTQLNSKFNVMAKPATKVIGTSTSGHTLEVCDVLCDGTNDESYFNSVIQSMTNGGKIVVLEGIYNITNEINLNKENIVLEGMGKATILKRMFATSGGSSSNYINTGVINIASDNVSIKDITINGNSDSYSYVEGNYNCGIYSNENLSNININNCDILNNYYGIKISSSSTSGDIKNNINIIDNYFYNNIQSLYFSNVEEITLDKNKIFNNGVNNSIGIYDSNFININNNHVSTCEGNGIYVNNSTNLIIDKNIIKNSSGTNKTGIFLSKIDNSSVFNNLINDCENIGIYVTNSNHNQINNNNVNECGSYGIHVITACNDNNISSNKVYNTNGVVLGTGATHNTLNGNNIMRGTGITSDYSTTNSIVKYTIWVTSGATKNLISNNMIFGKNYVNNAGSSAGNTFSNNKYN